ncbi:glycosyltransferase [Escherichia coli]
MNIDDWSEQDKIKLGNYLQWSSYRSERHKLLYVATPKVACTTIKWWFAALEGYSDDLRQLTDSAESDPELIIHDSHRVAPNVTGINFQDLKNCLESDSFFRFAVVRNPYKRIFSAWQSKILVREPLQANRYIGTDFYHHPIASASDITNAFEQFLEHVALNEALSYWDQHWTPQVDLLRPDLINYSCLTRIEECEELTLQLREHLGVYIPSPFQNRRSNESIIPYMPEFVSERSAELIRTLYSQDFDLLGYDKQPPIVKNSFSTEACDTAIKAIKFIRARHQRLDDCNKKISGLNSIVSESNNFIIGLTHDLKERDGEIAGLKHAISERDGAIVGLTQAIVERDGEITGLNQAIAERDGEITGLNQAIAERDGVITGLNQTIVERDGEITGLNQAIVERDGEIAGLNQAIVERDGEITGLNQAIAERDGEIAGLNHALVERDLQLDEKNTTINKLLNSNSWRITKPLRFLSRPLKLGEMLQTAFNREVRLIRHSSLFDANFYRDCYPDVRASKIDPARHYCLFGWKEHRDPSSSFSTHRYLELNPDVASAGINPLFHYIKYGIVEGRQNSLLQVTHEKTVANHVEATLIINEIEKDLSVQECHDAHDVIEVRDDYIDDNEITNQRIETEIKDIIKSGLFDAEYYLSMYPDIKLVSEDCIRHYCEIGWHQGLNPSDDFDTNTYLESYVDIKNAGLNPFWHYVVAGRKESRQATPDSNNRYEDDIYFGTINKSVQLISYYKNPNWSVVQQIRTTSNGVDQMLTPHDSVSFYSTSGACVFEQQAQMAKSHGISAWCFNLELSQNSSSDEPLLAFISNKDIDLNFILEVDLRIAKFDECQTRLVKQAISDKRYLHVDNRAAVVIILPHDDYASNEILSDFYSVVGVSDDLYKIVRMDAPIEKKYDFVRKYKLDGILDFPLSLLGEIGCFKPFQVGGTKSVPYSVVVSQAISRMKGHEECATPCYRTVTLGRYETSLKQDEPLRYTRFTQAEYRRWLDAALKDTKAKQVKNHRLLFINAWNDWELGATLEPDQLNGYSKLNETSRALLGFPVGLALPKVSVIVTNYNHEKYLRRRLDSIYHQTYKNIEVFLLDDCSTDNSREVLKEYAERFPDITTLLFNQKNSGGVFRQWAKGIHTATGDLVWIAESDDYCDANFLEKLVRCFDDEAVMLAYSKVEFVHADESVIPDEFLNYTRGLVCRDQWKQSYVKTAHLEVSEALGIINTIPNASGAIFRRPVNMPLLEDESWLSMRVVGDWILYLHQLRGGKIAYSAETTNYFRRYESSTATSAYKKEAFYRELGMASRAVVRLYDVPESVIEKAFERSKELYEHYCGAATEVFSRWFDKAAIINERRLRTPNIMVSTMAFHPGGAEILPIRIANELKRKGYSVILLSAGLDKREDGIRKLLRRDIPVVETSNVQLTRGLIQDFGIEVLNSHQWHVQKYPTHVHDVFSELKVHVASLHGMIEHTDAFGVTSEQLSVADKHVTTWVYTADKNLGPFIEHGIYENSTNKFIKLPNGMQPPVIEAVRRSDIGIPDDAFVLCCVSRAIPDKGWREAIEAVILARKISGKDIRLILVGNGPVYDEYCHSGVPDFVYLAGFSENSVGYYATADMGIMLTKFKSESFPLTIVDCLFAGKPYIATGVGEIKNMLTTDDGVAGQVIELEDWEVPVSQVAQVIATYATDSEALHLAEAMVEKAANRYKIDVVVEQYVSLFEKSRGNE